MENSDERVDKLDVIFTMQKALDGYITRERGLDFSQSEWIQKRMLALISELAEVLDEVKFKCGRIPLRSIQTR